MVVGLALGLFAFCTSGVNGLLGAGGAVLLIPLGLYALPYVVGTHIDPHLLSGLVLTQSVASAGGATLGYRRHGYVDGRLVLTYGPALTVGGLVGAVASSILPSRALLACFAVVISASAVLLALRSPSRDWPIETDRVATSRRRAWAGRCVLLTIGLLGGAVGNGAAFLIVPVMLYVLNVPTRIAAASALLTSVFLSVPALIAKAAVGQIEWAPAFIIGIAALGGARLGAHWSPRVPVSYLRVLLGVLMALSAIRIWADVL